MNYTNAPEENPSYRHPCFNRNAKRRYGRVHVPVALNCNMHCNYCNRLYDCVNESRPGVTSTVIEPKEAVRYLDFVLKEEPHISVVGIAGPGDPLHEPERTLETIERVHMAYPGLLICLSSNGLNVPEYVDRLVDAGVRHMTITVNTVAPDIGARIYRWLQIDRVFYKGKEAARILISRQLESIRRLKKRKITIKVNTVVIPKINGCQVEAVARKLSTLGVDLMNIIPLVPVAGTPFEGLDSPSNAEISRLRDRARIHIPQMRHCARCRADAIGPLDSDKSLKFARPLRDLQDNSSLNNAKGRKTMEVAHGQIALAPGA